MSAYFVLQIEWKTPEAQRTYVARLSDMIEKHGGRFLIGTSRFRVVEGAWRPGILVVIEFPTMAALSSWYDSEEYRSVRDYRLENARCDAVVAEGS